MPFVLAPAPAPAPTSHQPPVICSTPTPRNKNIEYWSDSDEHKTEASISTLDSKMDNIKSRADSPYPMVDDTPYYNYFDEIDMDSVITNSGIPNPFLLDEFDTCSLSRASMEVIAPMSSDSDDDCDYDESTESAATGYEILKSTGPVPMDAAKVEYMKEIGHFEPIGSDEIDILDIHFIYYINGEPHFWEPHSVYPDHDIDSDEKKMEIINESRADTPIPPQSLFPAASIQNPMENDTVYNDGDDVESFTVEEEFDISSLRRTSIQVFGPMSSDSDDEYEYDDIDDDNKSEETLYEIVKSLGPVKLNAAQVEDLKDTGHFEPISSDQRDTVEVIYLLDKIEYHHVRYCSWSSNC